VAKAPTKTQRAAEIGARIDVHLKRFEEDPKINRIDHSAEDRRLPPFYRAGAAGIRHRVFVRYVSFQGITYLSVEDAARYLAWLDAGHVGKHWKVIK
jgi:hypothetical protein